MKLPVREPNSHKGDLGKVMIVGGCKAYYGAPIFNALGAEHAGADLITLYLPKEHVECVKHYSLNIFIRHFVKGDLGLKDYGLILEEAKQNHVLLIGSGLGRDQDTQRAIKLILEEVQCPVVIDADALMPEILNLPRKSNWIVTPHQGEFIRLFGCEPNEKNAFEMAKRYDLTILLKGHVDYIASPKDLYANHTGCPQMRVGGTGDALAGITASFIAQGLSLHDAASSAAYYFGKAGENLAKKRNCFTTLELVRNFLEL